MSESDKSELKENANPMVIRKEWDEFRKAGLLWFVNRILHTFGWSIVVEVNDCDEVLEVYPSRVKFRGFTGEVEERGFRKISKYMKENAGKLLDEANE